MGKLFVAAALAMLGAPAVAEQPKPASQETEAAKKDPIVCKQVKDPLWRTASYKVCFKASKWHQIARDIQMEVDDYGRSGSFGNIGG